MRDIILTALVFASFPFIIKRPYVGILVWVWLSVMNPHRMCYGFAYSFPFAAIVAGLTFFSMLFSKEPKKLPLNAPVAVLIAFTGWMVVSTVTSFLPAQSYDMLEKVLKIMLMTLVTMMLVRTKDQLHALIYTLAGSLAFFGVKGGLFTIRSGGSDRVWGPAGSFIEGNNEVALAFVVLIPILFYIMQRCQKRWQRWGMLATILLCALAALGSYSRGALVAMVAMGLLLWLKSKKKMAIAVAMAMLIPAALAFMPGKWSERMDTIQTYQEDRSAMGRINAWTMTVNLALDRPLVGGGFVIYDAERFAKYSPNPEYIHVAHSIYFQVLGEHGFVGLALYLTLAFLVWRRAAWIMRHARGNPELKWAADLASMIQVSMVGFAVGGAFLSLAYFDVPYYLMAITIIAARIVEAEIAGSRSRTARAVHPVAAAGRAPLRHV